MLLKDFEYIVVTLLVLFIVIKRISRRVEGRIVCLLFVDLKVLVTAHIHFRAVSSMQIWARAVLTTSRTREKFARNFCTGV
jgi:hypothetical protein